MAFPPHEQTQGVKWITSRAAKQNPISTCILTFLKQIYMNFSFQLDGIKTHFPCSFFSIKQNTLMIRGLPTTLKRFGVIWQLTGKFLWRNPQRVAPLPTGRARCFSELQKSSQRVAHHPTGRAFAGGFWRPSRCRNWAQDSSLERSLSLLSNPTGIFQFGVDLTCQKSNLPRLVKKCQMRLLQGRVLLQSTFECLPQPQIELMIAHWKALCV